MERRSYRPLIPYAAVSVTVFIMNLGIFRGDPGGSGGVTWERFTVLAWNLGNYGTTALLPTGFGPFHPFFPFPGWRNFLIAGVILLVWLWGAIRFPNGMCPCVSYVSCIGRRVIYH